MKNQAIWVNQGAHTRRPTTTTTTATKKQKNKKKVYTVNPSAA